MSHFSNKIDQEMLDSDYYKIIVGQYKDRLKEHYKYIPLEELSKYMDYLSQSASYTKLLSCLAEWMALIELCDDLLERIHLYGIAHYIDLDSVT